MTILVVDDYPDMLDFLAFGLTQAGFTLATAAEGEQAVELLTQAPNRFEGVVTDMMLPGATNGAQVAAIARALRPSIPIVVMSGVPTSLMPFFAAGNDYHVLQKPFRLGRLCHLLRSAPYRSRVPAPDLLADC